MPPGPRTVKTLDDFFVKSWREESDKGRGTAHCAPHTAVTPHMHILIDASGLASAPHEPRIYFREMVRHLLLAAEWHSYTVLAWAEAKLGKLTEFLSPLSRPALARLALTPSRRTTPVLYSPIGFPSAGLIRSMPWTEQASPPRIGTWLGEGRPPGSHGASRIVTLTRSGMRRWADAGAGEDLLRWIPPGLEAEISFDRQAGEVELPDSDYVAAAGPGRRPSRAQILAVWRVLEAFRVRRRRMCRRVRLVFLGGTPPWVQNAAGCLGLSQDVDFLDGQGGGAFQRARVLTSALAFVHASRPDSSWLSAGEAMRRGVPILAPRTATAVEVFGDSALYYAERSAEDLAAEMERLMRSDHLRRTLARKGMARGQAFSWEAAARSLLDVFAEMGGAAAGSGSPFGEVGADLGFGYNPALSSHAQAASRHPG